MSEPALRFDVITLFPEMIEAVCTLGVIGRAVGDGRLAVVTHQLRDYTGGSPHAIDDEPYGGGPGMVMRPEPIYDAVTDVCAKASPRTKILMTPQGRPFSQSFARELAGGPGDGGILLFCGRYEGVDERVRALFDRELSIGDYVLTGGEIAAAAVIDAVGRLVPGVLGCGASTHEESFSGPSLEYPHYTRPEVFRGERVPPVLLSGNHAEIARWRREAALDRTRARRPDLIKGSETEDDE